MVWMQEKSGGIKVSFQVQASWTFLCSALFSHRFRPLNLGYIEKGVNLFSRVMLCVFNSYHCWENNMRSFRPNSFLVILNRVERGEGSPLTQRRFFGRQGSLRMTGRFFSGRNSLIVFSQGSGFLRLEQDDMPKYVPFVPDPFSPG